MPKSLQATITAADVMYNEYAAYKKIQTTYFNDQTLVNLNKLRDQGKMLDHAAQKYKKERDTK